MDIDFDSLFIVPVNFTYKQKCINSRWTLQEFIQTVEKDWNLSQSKVVTFLYVEVFASVGTFIHSTYISLPCTICYPISLKDNCHPTSPSWIPNRHVNQIAGHYCWCGNSVQNLDPQSIFICCFYYNFLHNNPMQLYPSQKYWHIMYLH